MERDQGCNGKRCVTSENNRLLRYVMEEGRRHRALQAQNKGGPCLQNTEPRYTMKRPESAPEKADLQIAETHDLLYTPMTA